MNNNTYAEVAEVQEKIPSLRRNAQDILMDIIKEKHNDNIGSETLLYILEENNFNIVRKSGSYKAN